MVKCYQKNYPRPQFVRKQWENLNGTWDFCFDDEKIGEKQQWEKQIPAAHQIEVPFTYETKASGIADETRHDTIWYQTTITVDESQLAQNDLMLHFEGSDFYTKVWVNGCYVGDHRGGYARFSFAITEVVKAGENTIVVKVEDSYDTQQPRGKQRWIDRNFGCWYVQTTGIWKTVWMEYVPKVHLEKVKMTPNMKNRTLNLEYIVKAPEQMYGNNLYVSAEIHFEGVFIGKTITAVTAERTETTIAVLLRDPRGLEWGIRAWEPGNPNLYDIEFQLLSGNEVLDEIGSYFAMREISIEGSKILLNGQPLYQRLILDQGYWKDSHLTPPSEEALIEDIEKIQALGYNGVRKHQKTEDERFLYWCDAKGVLVWSEVAAAYQYSEYAVCEFTKEWMEIVTQNYNHPCIITWTPFNESWGINRVKQNRIEQHFTEAIYHLTKSIDPYRPVIVNDGWEHTVSDIITLHDYEEEGEILYRRYSEYKNEILRTQVYPGSSRAAFADGYEYKGQPIIISEYGGIAFDNGESGWGYGNKVDSKEAFIERFDKITTAVKKIPYVCGFCYTQVSDVQQEINGLMDMERNFKIEPEIIKEINERKVN